MILGVYLWVIVIPNIPGFRWLHHLFTLAKNIITLRAAGKLQFFCEASLEGKTEHPSNTLRRIGSSQGVFAHMSTQKISFYMPNLDGGGAERVMINLANGIANRGVATVDFVVAVKKGDLLGEISEKVKLVDLGAKRIATSILPLAAYIRKNKPDVLLSALSTANVILILAGKLSFQSTTLIVTEHCALSVASGSPINWRARLIPWLISTFYPYADGIVAVSSGVADDLSSVSGIRRNKIEVIYNPVITPEVRTLTQEPCIDQWISDPSTPVLLSIGRLSPQKDFVNLLEAFTLVVKKRPVKLIILGEGELRKDLEALIDNLKIKEHVKMPGFVENPYSYMRNAQVFVLSSQWEGLPTCLLYTSPSPRDLSTSRMPSSA